MIIDCGMQVAAKTRGILLLVAVVAATVFFSYFNSRSTEVRLMTYNVRNAIGTDGVTDYGRVASVISHYDPDVVALQELDSMTRRSGGRDLLACLSAATGMKATWARAIAFDGGSYGIGVLSRETPLSVRVVPLPGSEEARRLLVVEFRDYVFACTHLSLDAGDRLASAGLIASAASGWEKPFFVAGDWNARPGDPFVAAMEAVGHTPGHTVFQVGRLLVVGDLFHGLALQLAHPEICATYDMDKEKAVETRKRFIRYAQENELTMAGMHLPAPAFH